MKNKRPIGTVTKNGYRAITKGSRNKAVRMYEHRMVMENFLGRKLLPEEHVHHKNENKLDNRIENLEIISNSEHQRMHSIKNGLGKDRKGVAPTNKTSIKIINEIMELRKLGMLLKDIQKKTGLSYPTVQKYASKI